MRIDDLSPTVAIVPLPHESTDIMGRGTEPVKTSELTGWIGPGGVGLPGELGRPGLGARFREIREGYNVARAARLLDEGRGTH